MTLDRDASVGYSTVAVHALLFSFPSMVVAAAMVPSPNPLLLPFAVILPMGNLLEAVLGVNIRNHGEFVSLLAIACVVALVGLLCLAETRFPSRWVRLAALGLGLVNGAATRWAIWGLG